MMFKIATALVVSAICYLAFFLLPQDTRNALKMSFDRSVGIQVEHFRASR